MLEPGYRGVPMVRLVREGAQLFSKTKPVVRNPGDIHRYLSPTMSRLEVEEFWLLTLDVQNKVTTCSMVSRGIVNSSLVHPREVFRLALAAGAVGIILAHNHPSGHPQPSADDRAVTRQQVEAGRVLDIPVYDHVIVAGDQYFSFAEAGML